MMAARGFLSLLPSRLSPNCKFLYTRSGHAAMKNLVTSQHLPNQVNRLHTDCFHLKPVAPGICSLYTLGSEGRIFSHHQRSAASEGPSSWCVARCYSKKAKRDKVKGGKKKIALNEEELEGVLDLPRLQGDMLAVVEDLKLQMVQQISVRTNLGAFDSLKVKTEDGTFPLIQLGQLVQKNPSLFLINMATSPQYIPAVKDAIANSGLNVNPQQDGTSIFIPIPKVTREHRENLAKNAKAIHDKAKIRLRDIHNKYVKKVKTAKDHHPEDVVKGAQDMVLNEMHSYEQQLDALLVTKQQELLGGK